MISLRLSFLMCCLFVRTAHCWSNCTTSKAGHVDCLNLGYRTIPPDKGQMHHVTYLNMHGNIIKKLGQDAFCNFSKLLNLNLSATGIGYLNEFTFRGLNDLRQLDLTNNPVLGNQTRLPTKLFEHCPQITHLYISGYPLRGTLFVPLKNLIEITITPSTEYLPYELADLPKLRILNFAFCDIDNSLTKDKMHPFAKTALEEMSFHVCDLTEIENNTFDDFQNLRLLNFAGNLQLKVNDVFETLSVSKGLVIEDLVLDMVGSKRLYSPVMLGPGPHGHCYQGVKFLKNLSIRGIKLLGVRENISKCFPHLETVSAGFNAPYFLNGVEEGHFSTHLNIRYVDISYLNRLDPKALKELIGFHPYKNWIAPNKSYFPRRIKHWDSFNCSIPQVGEKEKYNSSKSCPIHNFPQCLTYIKADHIHVAFVGNLKIDSCGIVSHNRVRYINISYPIHDKDVDISRKDIYGLKVLEILDVSGVGLKTSNQRIFTELPAIKELYIANNELGKSNLTKLQSSTLEVLDLSNNGIYLLPNNMFEFLTKIKRLYLAKNYLTDIVFLGEKLEYLNYVDISSNKIMNVASQTINDLERLHPNLSLDLTNNPLQCNCDSMEMVKWIQQTRIVLINRNALHCHDLNFTISAIDLNTMRMKCAYKQILLASLTPGIAIIMLTAFVLMYIYRWSIRWYYYKARFHRRYNHNEEYLLQGLNDETFSAFIIYAIEDDCIRPWVIDTLRKRIEVDWDKGSCFLRGRDDTPGNWDHDNITQGLLKSKTAVWVISPGFYEDTWCNYASNFAQMHLGNGNNAFLIMEERFEAYSQPKILKTMVTNSRNACVMIYADDLDGRNLFWAKLEQFFHF